jgi:hypothetical protein
MASKVVNSREVQREFQRNRQMEYSTALVVPRTVLSHLGQSPRSTPMIFGFF